MSAEDSAKASLVQQWTQLLTEEGPTCKCVLIGEDGVCTEVEVDMTPKVEAPKALIGGGRLTFLGQWPDMNVVILYAEKPPQEFGINKHTLPPPFAKKEVKGKILLTRSDDEALPLDFTLKEYEEFIEDCKNNPDKHPEDVEESDEEDESFVDNGEEDEEDDEEEEEEGDDDEDDEDDEEISIEEVVMQGIIDALSSSLNREPTEEEIEAVMEKAKSEGYIEKMVEKYGSLIAGMEGDEEDEEEDDDEEEEEEEKEEGGKRRRKSTPTKKRKREEDEEGEEGPEKKRASVEE